METLLNGINTLTGWLWSPPMIWLCLVVGIVFTLSLRFFQVRTIKEQVKLLLGDNMKSTEKGTSSFEAFAMSVASRVGTGNIVGVVTAIAYGGPGSVFWLWIIEILGAATSFAENTLAQVYKKRIGGLYRGGGAYYIKEGLGGGRLAGALAVIFAIFGFINTGLLTGIQPETMSVALKNAMGIPQVVTGIAIAAIMAVIIFGGVKRIAQFAAVVVPPMSLIYILVTIILLILNARNVPTAFGLIFTSAFGANSLFGGIVGAALSWGIKRGVYSSEAGMGTSSQNGATADTSHPAKQGLVQAFSTYVDMLVCTATALMLLVTNSYTVFDSSKAAIFAGANVKGIEMGVGYAQAALDTLLPHFGQIFIALAMVFFSFTTVVAEFNISESNLAFLYKGYENNKVFQNAFKIVFLIPLFVACVLDVDTVWNLTDIGVGLNVWVTCGTLLFMVPTVVKVWNDYIKQKKVGKDPIFRPSACGIRNADLWEEIADEYEAKASEKVTKEEKTK